MPEDITVSAKPKPQSMPVRGSTEVFFISFCDKLSNGGIHTSARASRTLHQNTSAIFV